MTLLVVLNAEAVSSATAASSQASMTVTPAQGARGSLVSLTGSGLPAHRRAGLFLGRHRQLARFRADRHGHWTVRTRIPSRAQVGNSSLRVVFGRDQVIVARFPLTATGASASSLTVLSSGEQVGLSPNRVPAGSFVALQGAGFQRRTLLGVWLGRTRLTRFRASGHGFRRALVRIPAATRAGVHVLSVRFRGRHLSLRLAVNSASPTAPGSGPGSPDPVVDAVGDMGCALSDPNYNGGDGVPSAVFPANNCVQKSVSDLIASPLPTALLDLGDNQYNLGELANYNAVYDPTFGRANSVVYPSLGNAEYANLPGNTAPGFFSYFANVGVFFRIQADGGDSSNLIPGGYYSFNLGAWHIIALNSNCVDLTHGCGVGSPEELWLKNDLAAHPGMCTLAYWHHPLFNSGANPHDASSQAFWNDLYAAHADIVLNGHGNHHYERFGLQNPAAGSDANGIREFIVSTGGQSHGLPGPTVAANSEVRNYTVFGMLQLTLHPTGYDWHYVAAGGSSFTDSGSGTCHL